MTCLCRLCADFTRVRRGRSATRGRARAAPQIAARERDDDVAVAVRRRATATALVPDALVSPTPRSHTRAVTRPGPSTRTTCTFVRFGNRGCVSSSGPIRGRSSGSPTTTACGLPTSTGDHARGRRPRSCRRTLHVAQLLLDLAVRRPARDDLARRRRARASVSAAEPRGDDPRRVPGHLRGRAVRVPDHDVRPVVAARGHLDDAVGVTDLADARARGRARSSATR